MKKQVIVALATGFYIGRVPVMPGTFGTLLGLPLVGLLYLGGPVFYTVSAALLVFISIGVAELYETYMDSHDPKEVVIDEIVGYVIAMTLLPLTWQAFLAAFLIFRLLDILKPFPIGRLDRQLPGGFGTVLDDVAAGLITNIALHIIDANSSLLGVRLHAF